MIEREQQLARERKAAESREALPEEPEASDPQACHIVFRLPGSGERVNRRFLKEQTVEVLYRYIDSIIDKI
jgi:hypothetical protein